MQSVLIVENNPIVLEQLCLYVTECDFNVHCAEGIETAMVMLRNHRHSTVILDWDLPSEEAIEIIQQIRGNHRLRRMHVMVVSPTADPVVVEAAMSSGADDFFTMPIGASELRKRLMWASSPAQLLV